MTKDKREYVIRVTKVGADYHTELLENGVAKNDDLDFDKNADGLKKTDHYKLEFTIDNSQLADADKVRFAPSDADVMAVHTDLNTCPPTGSQLQNVFWVDKNKTGNKLQLINMDLKVEKLRFKINMVKISDPTATSFIELDPIIKNGNQGGSEPFSNFAVAPLLTGAIVGIGAAVFANAALVPQNALVFGIGGAIVGLIVGLVLDRR